MGEAKRRRSAMGINAEFIVPLHKCPNCGQIFEKMSAINPKVTKIPSNDVICICSKCHHIFARRKNGETRELNDEEMLDIAGDKFLLEGMKWRFVKKRIL